ncbi:hypothetical protein E4U02_11020 [Microbacterium paludicola]|uniref:Secreted protein n=1 Tax=Microbacterium paludicola TaxID=300019 RepID=A0A4Y9FSZ8_9MICO|nr:hypothetical protein [Microbacterium paludicola]MBF0816944.1 hypothetical protein [Microbacterium paludicola]TFU32388.1 hypothetical protein E4U02_11020 [Microbacterium paludicola]
MSKPSKAPWRRSTSTSLAALIGLGAMFVLTSCDAAQSSQDVGASEGCLYPPLEVAARIAEEPHGEELSPKSIVAVGLAQGERDASDEPLVVMMSFGADGEQVGLWALSELTSEAEVQSVDQVARNVTLWAPSSEELPAPSDAELERARACLA